MHSHVMMIIKETALLCMHCDNKQHYKVDKADKREYFFTCRVTRRNYLSSS